MPSATNFDFTAGSIAYDGGVATAGYEFPYDGAQCVFIYNKNKVCTPLHAPAQPRSYPRPSLLPAPLISHSVPSFVLPRPLHRQITSPSDVALIKTIDGLRTWIKANPGRFTYAAPSLDATGKVLVLNDRPLYKPRAFINAHLSTPYPVPY